MIRVRSADPHDSADWAALMSFQVATFPGDPPVDPTDASWWIAEAKGPGGPLPAGFIGLQTWHQGEALTGYLVRVGVLPDFRGQGLMRRLTRALLSKARQLGLRRVVTDTYNNPASANNLIACGFRTIMPDILWAGDGAVFWERRIE